MNQSHKLGLGKSCWRECGLNALAITISRGILVTLHDVEKILSFYQRFGQEKDRQSEGGALLHWERSERKGNSRRSQTTGQIGKQPLIWPRLFEPHFVC